MASTLTFLEWYHEDGDKVLNHIIQVTGNETWVSFVNVETKERSKQWTCTHYPNKLKKLKQMSACQKAVGSCFLGQERSADGGNHATRDHNNVRSVLRNTKKPSRTIQNQRCEMLTSSVVLLHDNDVHIHLFTLKHCFSISTGSCLTTLLSALISLWGTTTCLPTWITGWDHSASTIMRSSWKVSKYGWAHRW
jgi:hypothetical protein